MTDAPPGLSQSALTDLSVRAFADRLASSDPAPGGGTASALAAALGASLVSMVAALTTGRPAYAEVDTQVQEIAAIAARLQDQLLELGQTDADAYDAVVRARRMAKETDEQRVLRATALTAAMRDAAETPMRTADVALEVLALAARIAGIGNRNAASDAGVAALLAATGARGAALNVRINLPYLADGEHRDELAGRLDALEERVSALLAEAMHVVGARIA